MIEKPPVRTASPERGIRRYNALSLFYHERGAIMATLDREHIFEIFGEE